MGVPEKFILENHRIKKDNHLNMQYLFSLKQK